MGFETDFEKWKDADFGPYCFKECLETCCDMRNASLHVNKDELARMLGKKLSNEELAGMGIRAANVKGLYYFDTRNFCPKFDSQSRKCLDYNRRPLSCRDFPFIVEKDAVIIKNGCYLKDGSPEYKKLLEIASLYGKVIVKRSGK